MASIAIWKIVLVFALVFAAGFLGGCATAGKSIPQQIPDALNQACALYTKAKPEVLAARSYAVAHWNDKIPGTDKDVIPAEVKKTLQEFDSYLPDLDKAGVALCAASGAVNVFASAGQQAVDWNQVLTVVLKAASVAIDLKAKGAI